MDQKTALKILQSGENCFLTGPAGSGKTHVLNQFIKYAKNDGLVVAVTATTGLASMHLGGQTIHAWSGVGINDYLHPEWISKFSKTKHEQIERTDILIIDEISMMHDFRFDMINQICQEVRKNDQPFGGIQVVLCGDFFQLPPVNRNGSRQGGFVVHSDAWEQLNLQVLYLQKSYRQSDEDFLDILNAIRGGDVRRHHAEKLLSRTNITPTSDDPITELHTTNIDVDKKNQIFLEKIDTESIFHHATTKGKKHQVENLKKSILAPESLELKKGALVMAVRNSLEKKFVNGSLGKIIDFEPETNYPIVEFFSGREVKVTPETWEIKDGEKTTASFCQIPLRLAYAITVHKSQGMTLDSAVIDLSKAFTPGMGYVALSRVKSLDNLYLSGINKTALKTNPEAIVIDEYLKRRTTQ